MRLVTDPPYPSLRWLVFDDRNCIGRYPEAECNSTPSKPAARAFFVAFAYSSITLWISVRSSARGVGISCMPKASVHICPAGLTADGAIGEASV